MKPLRIKTPIFFACSYLLTSLQGYSQDSLTVDKKSEAHSYHFSGKIYLTNNGLSLVPNFSLGKPAVITNLSFGGNRFTVEPDIRFSLSAKPWTMLFWGRYRVVSEGKFRLRTGAHLGLNYRVSDVINGGAPEKANIVRRYLAAELVPTYALTKHTGLGIYYLYSYGMDPGTVGNTHFITFDIHFTDIQITRSFYVGFTPLFYFLKQDNRKGTYLNSTFQAGFKEFPLSLSGSFNQRLTGDIIQEKNFLWSLSLVYSFSKKLIIEKKQAQ